jgi:bile acid:Na+ symporter, BASS family
MLLTLNNFLQKCMPIITPLSVVIGVMFADFLVSYEYLVPWVFAFMTFAGSLGSNFQEFQHVIRHPLPLFICLINIYIILPFISLLVGNVAFSNDPYLITGSCNRVFISSPWLYHWISIC